MTEKEIVIEHIKNIFDDGSLCGSTEGQVRNLNFRLFFSKEDWLRTSEAIEKQWETQAIWDFKQQRCGECKTHFINQFDLEKHEISIIHHAEGYYTIIGNPNTVKFWSVLKGTEYTQCGFVNDDNQIDESVDELRDGILKKYSGKNSITLTLIAIDDLHERIMEWVEKAYNKGHVVANWEWNNDFYDVIFPNEPLEIYGQALGSDNFTRYGKYPIEDIKKRDEIMKLSKKKNIRKEVLDDLKEI